MLEVLLRPVEVLGRPRVFGDPVEVPKVGGDVAAAIRTVVAQPTVEQVGKVAAMLPWATLAAAIVQ